MHLTAKINKGAMKSTQVRREKIAHTGECNPTTTRTRTLPNLPPNHQNKGEDADVGEHRRNREPSSDLANTKSKDWGEGAFVPLQTTPAHMNLWWFFHPHDATRSGEPRRQLGLHFRGEERGLGEGERGMGEK